jgi:4-carboxymuconolactone decarboxylase
MTSAAGGSSLRGRVTLDEHERTLRRLTIGDDAYIEATLAEPANLAESQLDRKTRSLVRLGALIAADAAPPSYMDAIACARAHHASDDELVGCLIAVLPIVGAARVTSAAPKLALALGYDVTAALEDIGDAHD